MSFERPSTQTETSPIQKEIENLENKKQELEMIHGSLVYERKNERAALHEQVQAPRRLELLSDHVIGKGEITDEDKEALARAQESVVGAEEWAAMPHDTMRSAVTDGKWDDPLVEKLRDLGVDMRGLSYEHPEPAIQMVRERITEIEGEIREKKLLVPGGKEELVLEAITRDNLLGETYLGKTKDVLRHFTSVGVEPDIERLVNTLPLHGNVSVRWYPLEVKKAVAWQILTAATKLLSENRQPETLKKIEGMRAEIDAAIERV